MARGVKPIPTAEKLHHRLVTRVNDEDFQDLKKLVNDHDGIESVSELLRELLQSKLRAYRQANFKQMRIE
tara:strand:+ start:376 stop:585 length:210 start_codon:yes stop_codon:yes gene_type:complete